MSVQMNDAAVTTQNQEKRERNPTRKALKNEIDSKRKELDKQVALLQKAYENALKLDNDEEDHIQCLENAAERYKETLQQLTELYQKDKWGDYEEEAKLTKEYSRLERARKALSKGLSDNDREPPARSTCSRSTATRSSVSRATSSSSSSSRRKALAEAAAARKQAEFDRMMAEKERARRLREAEERQRKEVEQAQHDLDMAILAADRAQAVADARLKAIEDFIDDEQSLSDPEDFLDPVLPVNGKKEGNIDNTRQRIQEWINTHPLHTPALTPHRLGKQPIATSTPAHTQDLTVGMLETFAATNQRLVSGLTKQSHPKNHSRYR